MSDIYYEKAKEMATAIDHKLFTDRNKDIVIAAALRESAAQAYEDAAK